MPLSRNTVFGIGVAAIFLFIALNRIEHWNDSRFAEGEVIRHSNGYRSSYSIIRFRTSDGSEFTFSAERNYELAIGEKVKVIYKDDGSDAEVFSFIGFFLAPMIYGITPLILWAAASLSFIAKGETVTFSFKGIRKNKQGDAGIPKMDNEMLDTFVKKLNTKGNKKS